jgi:hypothetical protein
MSEKEKKLTDEAKGQPVIYTHREMHFFNSFEEQAAYELKEMAALTPHEILQQLRHCITIAYGMHGYDPDKVPTKHSVRIIEK